jgi:hypothetical protein
MLLVAVLSAVSACTQTTTAPNTTAPPGYFNVLNYGAKANAPSFDNTAAFQSALNAAASAGGGVVWVPVGAFWFAGNLSIGHNVVMAGASVGPYDPADPTAHDIVPALFPQSDTGAAFLTIAGQNSALQDVLIYYPNQVAPNAAGVDAAGPHVYPPTVLVLQPAKIYRCTLTNSYIGISVQVGRVILENLDIGGFSKDIVVDQAQDFVQISHITISPAFWDYYPLYFPQPIDTWVANHGVALTSYRADALSVEDFNVFWRNTGIALLDSQYGNTYGTASDLDLEINQYGVIAQSTNQIVGFEFTNLSVGGPAGMPTGAMIWLPAGGVHPPRVVVEGGVTWNQWAQPIRVDAGTLVEQNITGLNPIGWLPAIGLTPPALPRSGVSYVSNMPTAAQVAVSGGSVQDVQINGQSTGLTSGTFEISPGQSIAVTYTSAPTWRWDLE